MQVFAFNSYDSNGNLKRQTVNGQTTRFGWDDEDRLYSQTFADGHRDSYGYTGLGMRLTKNDPTGGYSYLADGVSPASPLLTDGRTTFTPGVSEYSGSLGSRFYLGDAQGNSRALLDGGQNATDGYNWDAFGSSVSRFGSNPTAFAWNGASGYQTDNDSGLKLLGHRYYDSRTGRFISQDHAGAGNNWYAYCGNNPMNSADPSGNVAQTVNGGSASISGPGYLSAESSSFQSSLDESLQPYFNHINAEEEVAKATVSLFSPSVTQEIRDDLELIAGTDRGAEILAQAGLDGLHLSIINKSVVYPDQRGVPGSSENSQGVISFDPNSLQYFQLKRADGYDTITPLVSIAHEMGHALTGANDDGFYNMNNVNENENPIVTQLGISPRTSYDLVHVFPNPYRQSGYYYQGARVNL